MIALEVLYNQRRASGDKYAESFYADFRCNCPSDYFTGVDDLCATHSGCGWMEMCCKCWLQEIAEGVNDEKGN